MCRAAIVQPRKPATRPAHLCRGRGGRGCRCHVSARPRLARAPRAHLPPREVARDPRRHDQTPHRQPHRPQAPPPSA